ncbi:hypothetical protein ACFSTE_15770 [Aquimarina hainanensis]|uniref:Uncharacterized protein n=1 Tax=Aquimarina hainanensis TaxID=1578017 RepID=A0ABW5NB05_9FLAO
MIYDSVDTVPAKIYFKILETNDLSLLTTGPASESELQEAWSKIEKENSSNTKEEDKATDLIKKIEGLEAKYESIKLAIKYLHKENDDELIDLLKGYGYMFTGNMTKDLNTITRESKALNIIIKRLQKKLPKQKIENKPTFDMIVLSCAAINGLGFVDTNTITLSQFNAHVEISNQKIEALQANGEGR